jgi:hypothetical protein
MTIDRYALAQRQIAEGRRVIDRQRLLIQRQKVLGQDTEPRRTCLQHSSAYRTSLSATWPAFAGKANKLQSPTKLRRCVAGLLAFHRRNFPAVEALVATKLGEPGRLQDTRARHHGGCGQAQGRSRRVPGGRARGPSPKAAWSWGRCLSGAGLVRRGAAGHACDVPLWLDQCASTV